VPLSVALRDEIQCSDASEQAILSLIATHRIAVQRNARPADLPGMGSNRPVAEHLVAHTRGGDRSLVEPERVRWLWQRVREAFPDAIASTVMPDHLHLGAPPEGAGRFERVLRGFGRRYGVRWKVLPPEPANSAAILARQVRYVFRNPVMAGLVDDVWEWPWSTLRDLAGVVADPWTQLRRVARMCGQPPQRLLQFVTSVEGRAAPPLARPREGMMVASFDACRAAAAAALRCTFAETATQPRARAVVLQLAYRLGSPSKTEVAAELGCSVRTVQRALEHPDPAVDVALKCLADPRLQISDVGPRGLRR
jgi:hypothetical protein